MTGSLQFSGISIIGVVAATFVGQFISAMWFGPLFNKQWTKYCGWDVDQIKKYMKEGNRHTKAVWGSLVETLIAQIFYAILLHNLQITSIVEAMVVGAIAWAGFMATVGLNEVLWHGMKIQFYILNQSSYLVRTVVMGAVYSFIAYNLGW